MSNLLQVVKIRIPKDKSIPVMAEFPVNPECAPFLVSSSKGLIWVDVAHPGDVVKAAPRQGVTPAVLFAEVVDAVQARGLELQWGNVHPLNENGVRAAIQHVKSFDLGELEALVPRVREEKDEQEKFTRPDWLTTDNFGLPFRPSSWVADDCVVIVPKDREFVGMVGRVGHGAFVVVIHNASRGIAVARG